MFLPTVPSPGPLLPLTGAQAASRAQQTFIPAVRAAGRSGALALGLLSLSLVACSPGGSGAGGGKPAGGPGGGGMPPPPAVGVVTVQPTSVALATELPGRLEARRTAQVRARVPGIVQQRLFTEGSLVKAGQALYKLDAGTYEAALASAQAGVARADAAVASAQAEVERNRPLAEAKAISAQEWLLRQTTLRVAQADMATARAAVQAARVNLEYTAIQAPISGRIGRSQVSEGALVGQGDVSPLAVIQQTDPLFVNFTQSAADVLRLRQAVESGRLQRAGDGATEVRVVLGDGSAYPLPGRLLFTDPTVDPTTGQVSLRAELPNPNGLLFPGLFVQVRLSQASAAQGIRLPQQAVTRGSDGDTVLVVGDDNKPVKRNVKISGAVGGDWVVLGGLKTGERVIADGFQKMFVPGAPVTPVPWSPVSAQVKAASAPASAPVAAPASASAASR